MPEATSEIEGVSVTTTDELHAAIINTCREHFGARCRYGRYQLEDPALCQPCETLEAPALILRAESATAIEIEDYPGCDTAFRLDLSLAIFCVLTIDTPGVLQQKLVELAAHVAALVQGPNADTPDQFGNRWGIDQGAIGFPTNITLSPVDINLFGRDCWAVRWSQQVYIDRTLPF